MYPETRPLYSLFTPIPKWNILVLSGGLMSIRPAFAVILKSAVNVQFSTFSKIVPAIDDVTVEPSLLLNVSSAGWRTRY